MELPLTIIDKVLEFRQKVMVKGKMAGITFQFDRAKALETILYLSHRISDSDIYGICKLLYLADKTSLEKYGRFIFGETYSALKEGSTPSHAYDLLKEASKNPISGLEVKGIQVISHRDADLDFFSESDIECLEQIIKIWGSVPNWSRGQATHDEAWKKAWDKRAGKGSVKIPVESIAELFDNYDDLIEYLSNSEAG
jgi:uncharacterized phage-associated protein